MKLLGMHILTKRNLSVLEGKVYLKALNDIKTILQNKDKHTFFFDATTVHGDELRFSNLVFIGSKTVHFNKDVTIDHLTVDDGRLKEER